MRVVIHTHVFISSFLGTGFPHLIIDLWKNGRITLCLSREIVDEYIEVLERLGLDESREIGEIIQLFARGYHSIFCSETPNIQIVGSDPDNDKLFKCAVALNAGAIISGDKAVLKVGKYMGIEVLDPAQFVATLPHP